MSEEDKERLKEYEKAITTKENTASRKFIFVVYSIKNG